MRTLSAWQEPLDRATDFRAVEGGTEVRSGTTLLVEAYAAIWIILFVMLWLGHRKQRRMDARIDELDRAIAAAAATPASAPKRKNDEA